MRLSHLASIAATAVLAVAAAQSVASARTTSASRSFSTPRGTFTQTETTSVSVTKGVVSRDPHDDRTHGSGGEGPVHQRSGRTRRQDRVSDVHGFQRQDRIEFKTIRALTAATDQRRFLWQTRPTLPTAITRYRLAKS